MTIQRESDERDTGCQAGCAVCRRGSMPGPAGTGGRTCLQTARGDRAGCRRGSCRYKAQGVGAQVPREGGAGPRRARSGPLCAAKDAQLHGGRRRALSEPGAPPDRRMGGRRALVCTGSVCLRYPQSAPKKSPVFMAENGLPSAWEKPRLSTRTLSLPVIGWPGWCLEPPAVADPRCRIGRSSASPDKTAATSLS